MTYCCRVKRGIINMIE